MTIYHNNFKPTYLYIKKHSITGKLYFGKTVKNPEKYHGSGLHWCRHIKTHGTKFIKTLWYCLFYDQEECTKFALLFSEQQSIVESDEWLNMMVENGTSAPNYWAGLNENDKKLLRKKISNSSIGRHHTEETRNKMSKSKTGNSLKVVTCPHCSKCGGLNAMNRYHFNNCKNL